MVVLKNTGWNHTEYSSRTTVRMHLSTEAVQGLALTLKSVHDVESRNRLAAGMLGVCNGILNDVLKEGLQNTTGLLVHHTGDALDATTAGNTTDRGLGDAVDVITHNLTETLGTSLTFSFARSGHNWNE